MLKYLIIKAKYYRVEPHYIQERSLLLTGQYFFLGSLYLKVIIN
jgi:hypothetical protein